MSAVFDDYIVKINNVSFTRGDRVIFKKINIAVPRGKITVIVGPSGTGKTTLLRLICGQLLPDSGTIEVMGQNIARLDNENLFKLRKHLGLLFQSGALFNDLTVFENVAFPLREHTQLSESMIKEMVYMKLEAVGLRNAHALMPHELSGGMARRVSLARTIALDPDLLMYDEPFAGQDPISLGVLLKLAKTLNDSLGMTSIIVSHDIAECMAIADYMYVLAQGEVVAHGKPFDLKHSHDAVVSQFLNGIPDGPISFNFPGIDYKTDILGEN